MTHTLIQDCAATAIPAGDALTLTSGTEVFITQTLGGNVTVRTDRGLFRIAKENSGAIGGYTPAAAEVDRRLAELRHLLDVEGFAYDRRFIFRCLAMGHSQFAELIGARGPNTQINAAEGVR